MSGVLAGSDKYRSVKQAPKGQSGPALGYLDEYSYRFDRRWREGELFGFVLRRVARGKPLPYRQLVAEGTA